MNVLYHPVQTMEHASTWMEALTVLVYQDGQATIAKQIILSFL